MEISLDEIRIPEPPAQVRWTRRVLWMILLTVLVLMTLCLLNISVDWNRVVSGWQRNLPPLLRGFSRPSGAVFNLAVQRMFESFNMAVVGTTIGGVLSFPLSFLAASNLLGSGRLAIPGKAFLAG
ncbi:MAG: hypothetical protein Q6L60_05085, partial [Thermostichus sp. HHBFW_bins_43]